jgi:hypothetical protein
MISSSWNIFLGEGANNQAYTDHTKKLVLKIKKSRAGIADTPERSVALWNEINAHLKPSAALISDSPYGRGWTCPYIEGKQASDEEISSALLSIYARTSRIVIDGPQDNNFKKTIDGTIVCVDIGAAYLLEKRPERRKSIVSLQVWDETRRGVLGFLNEKYSIRQKSVNTVKALFYLQNNHCDFTDVNSLQNNHEYIQKLSESYDKQQHKRVVLELEKTNEVKSVLSLMRDLRATDKRNFSIIQDAITELKKEPAVSPSCVEKLKQTMIKLYDIDAINLDIKSADETLEKIKIESAL